MIENENTEDPVREKPTTGHELNSRDQNHEPADLGKAELWADILLGKYWNRKIPVDPNSIAVKMGIEVYFAPIPGGLAGAILKTRKEETPKIFVDNNASTSRKRFTIAHELGHCVEKLIDSEPPRTRKYLDVLDFPMNRWLATRKFSEASCLSAQGRLTSLRENYSQTTLLVVC